MSTSLDRWRSGPDSYEQRPEQEMTDALYAEAEQRMARIRVAMSKLRRELTRDEWRQLGYIEGLHDGMSFGRHGTTLKNHLLTLGDYEADWLGGAPEP